MLNYTKLREITGNGSKWLICFLELFYGNYIDIIVISYVGYFSYQYLWLKLEL
ncbi:hypothetical protein [Okeania sp. SIO3I5]|uniref:hypothetical protein n=1 Tax=Okeania sp. SIO3I5 TaxID=2607805 RepID=UPI0025E2D003|nr:hypothetical protein [Okeania sp. SIO3I5]